jgi:hypothetical protein
MARAFQSVAAPGPSRRASSIALTDRAAIKAKIALRDHTRGQNMTIE